MRQNECVEIVLQSQHIFSVWLKVVAEGSDQRTIGFATFVANPCDVWCVIFDDPIADLAVVAVNSSIDYS